MTSEEIDFANLILRDMLETKHAATDSEIASRIGLPQDWRGRWQVYRYLKRIDLIIQETDEPFEYIGVEGRPASLPDPSFSLTPDGIEAAKVGLSEFLHRRKERQDMRYKADRATARGYRINVWGIIFLVFGLAVSIVNMYIFYRQVFDPPLKGAPRQDVRDAQNTQINSESIDGEHSGEKDANAASRGSEFGKESAEVADSTKQVQPKMQPQADAP